MPNPYFPFHDLGFRANPFRALEDSEWADIVVLTPAALQAANSSGHLQVLGDPGRGKTSTLLGLQAHLRRAGQSTVYEYLPEQQEVFHSPLDGVDVFLLDEAQRLSATERARLLRAAPAHRLILASHEDLTPLFAAANQPLATLHPEAGGRQQLEALLIRRLTYFALTPAQPAISFDDSAITYLQNTFGADLRALHWFLYEFFQSLSHTGVITAAQLRSGA